MLLTLATHTSNIPPSTNSPHSLAQAELHIALASVFRRFTFELYETDVTDVALAYDWLLPAPKLGSKGVRVKVTKDELHKN